MEPSKRNLSCFYYRGAVEGIVFYLVRIPFDEIGGSCLSQVHPDDDGDDDGDGFNTFIDLTTCQAVF